MEFDMLNKNLVTNQDHQNLYDQLLILFHLIIDYIMLTMYQYQNYQNLMHQ